MNDLPSSWNVPLPRFNSQRPILLPSIPQAHLTSFPAATWVDFCFQGAKHASQKKRCRLLQFEKQVQAKQTRKEKKRQIQAETPCWARDHPSPQNHREVTHLNCAFTHLQYPQSPLPFSSPYLLANPDRDHLLQWRPRKLPVGQPPTKKETL